MPHRRDSLYSSNNDEQQTFLTSLEQRQSLTSHRQIFLQESHHRRSSFNDSRRSSIARRRSSSAKSHLTALSQQNEASDEANAAKNTHELQSYDRPRKDAGSRFKQTIIVLGDLSKLSPESVCNSRHVCAISALGESPIHPITKIVVSSSGCVALLNDHNQVHLIGNISAIGLSPHHTMIGTGYRDIAMLYSVLILLDSNSIVSIQSQSAPKPCQFFSKVPIRQIASSDRHAALVSESGELYTFGSSQGGALGHGREWPDEPEPRLVQALQGQKVRSSSCGTMFTVIVVDEYHVGSDDTLFIVYSCGLGCNGRLGHGDFDSRWVPSVINALSDPIAAISCGDCHCLALMSSGIVYSWGGNSYGQLGYESSDSAIPKAISLEDITVSAISAGNAHSAVLTTGGKLYMFGSNRYGQLAVNKKQILGVSKAPMASTELAHVEIERIFCGVNFTVTAVRELIHTKICDKQSRRRPSADEFCYQKPQLDVADRHHETAGFSSESDYHSYIVIDEMFAQSSVLHS